MTLVREIIVPESRFVVGNWFCGKVVWRNSCVRLERILLRKIRSFRSRILAMKKAHHLMLGIGNRIATFRFLFVMKTEDSQTSLGRIQIRVLLGHPDPKVIV